MKSKRLIVSLFFLTFVFTLFFYFQFANAFEESTTQNIEVIEKGQSSQEQWIVISNERRIYIEDFSIWALIEENKKYTIVYDQMKKSGRYMLRTIVPGDYNGRF